MSSFHGLDLHAAPALIAELQRWTPRADEVNSLVGEAERLADLPVGVSLQLDAIGVGGRLMAQATSAAHDELVQHHLSLRPVGPTPRVRAARGGTDNTKDSDHEVIRRRLGGGGVASGTLSPTEQSRVDELVAAIRLDTAAGRDPVARFRDLNRLLDRATGDPAGPSRAWATSLVFAGLDGRRLATLFASGSADLVLRIGDAIRSGQTPAEAELPALLFPAGYVQWHHVDAQRAQVQQTKDRRSLAWYSIMRDHRSGGLFSAELKRMRAHPAVGEVGRSGIDRLLRGEQWSDLDLRRRLHLALVIRTDLAEIGARADRLEARLAEVRVDTFGQTTQLGRGGTLGTFDALAATASMALRPPTPVVGRALAHWLAGDHDGVELRDVARLAECVAADDGAAAAFFSTLGPERTAHVLHDLQLDGDQLRPGHAGLAAGGLAHDLSVALGRASSSLTPGFAVALINTQPEPIGAVVGAIPPEVLFAHGEFDGEFLVAAAATSVEVHDGRVILPPADWHGPNVVDARDLLLDRVVDANRGADLVRALDANGTARSLVWGGVVMAGTGVLGVLRPDRPSVRSRLLEQVGDDAEASTIVVEVAAERLDTLDHDTAQGLSRLLAAQIPNHLGAGIDAPYFVAARNVFAAGAGVELDLAVRVAVLEELIAGFESGLPRWFDAARDVGSFAGRVDGVKFVVFEDDAAARDAAIEHSTSIVAGLTSGLGIATGLAGIAFTGGAALPLAIAGMTASGAGWVAPMFFHDPENRREHYRTGMFDALHADRTGEAITLWAAAASGAISIVGGSVGVSAAEDGHSPVMSIAAGWHRDIPVDLHDPRWVIDARQLLDDAGAAVHVDPAYPGQPVDDALDLVGDRVFSNGYVTAFEQQIAQAPPAQRAGGR